MAFDCNGRADPCSSGAGIEESCKRKWILVLTQMYADCCTFIKGKLLDGKGQSKDIGFKFESNTGVTGSCSIVWLGRMIIFGGLTRGLQAVQVPDIDMVLS